METGAARILPINIPQVYSLSIDRHCLNLQRVYDKPSQRQCRSMESEYICGMLIGSMLAAQVSIGNTLWSERQNLSETASGDGM